MPSVKQLKSEIHKYKKAIKEIKILSNDMEIFKMFQVNCTHIKENLIKICNKILDKIVNFISEFCIEEADRLNVS